MPFVNPFCITHGWQTLMCLQEVTRRSRALERKSFWGTWKVTVGDVLCTSGTMRVSFVSSEGDEGEAGVLLCGCEQCSNLLSGVGTSRCHMHLPAYLAAPALPCALGVTRGHFLNWRNVALALLHLSWTYLLIHFPRNADTYFYVVLFVMQRTSLCVCLPSRDHQECRLSSCVATCSSRCGLSCDPCSDKSEPLTEWRWGASSSFCFYFRSLKFVFFYDSCACICYCFLKYILINEVLFSALWIFLYGTL